MWGCTFGSEGMLQLLVKDSEQPWCGLIQKKAAVT